MTKLSCLCRIRFGGVNCQNWNPDNAGLLPTENLNTFRAIAQFTTQTGRSCRVWCGGVNRVGPTSAFSGGVCRAAQALPVRPPDALRRRTHLSVGLVDSVHTARHDTDSIVLSCLAGGVNWTLYYVGCVSTSGSVVLC